MQKRTDFHALIAALLLAMTTSATADFDQYGHVSFSTDFAFRGVSQTMSRPAIVGEYCIDHDSGAYGFLWASNVDFTDEGDPDDGAKYEIDVGVGYAYSLSDRWILDLGVTSYFFPGTKPGADYNYVEWLGAIELDETHRITVGYADNALGGGGVGLFYSASSGLALPADLWLGVEIGHYDLDDALEASYSYAEAGIGGALERFEWRVSYHTTTSDAETIFYKTTVDDRVALTLNIPFD